MKKNHKNKFKTPEGYFDNFNERLFERLTDEEKIEESSAIPRSDGFGVPEGYFDSVYASTIKRMDGKSSKIISLRKYQPFYYAAAAIAVIFALTLAWNWNETTDVSFEDLASTDFDTYFENNDLGLSSYEIAEVVNLEDISLEDITDENIGDETILDYLDENVDEIEDLELNYEELQ